MSAKDGVPIFKLTDLLQLYTDRLIELGVDITGRIHSTYLQNRILANVPGLNSYKQCRDVIPSINDGVEHALRDACVDDADDEAICLAKAACIIRRNMFGLHTEFDGSFPRCCQALFLKSCQRWPQYILLQKVIKSVAFTEGEHALNFRSVFGYFDNTVTSER